MKHFLLQERDLYACLSVSVSLSGCLSLCPPARPSICPTIRPPVRPSVQRSFRRSVCPSVGLSFCRSVVPSVRRTVGPSVCRSVGLSVRRSVRPSVGEPHPFPVRGSPTRVSASGQQIYEGWSNRISINTHTIIVMEMKSHKTSCTKNKIYM